MHRDHLRTPKFLTNDAQQIVWATQQTAFGVATLDENPDGDANANAIKFNFRFIGQ